ncbi:MAG: hypothetical protein LBC78_03270 [Oscillospiraceae bacterium]|jgi:hypothetical protein|nr:hypothetical protein [Oscillospiraceae bacterium]
MRKKLGAAASVLLCIALLAALFISVIPGKVVDGSQIVSELPATTPPLTPSTPPETVSQIGTSTPVFESPMPTTSATLPATGTRQTIAAPVGREQLSILIDSAVFEILSDGGSNVTYLVRDKNAFIDISLETGEIAAKKGSFLEYHVPNWTDFSDNGSVMIPGTAVSADASVSAGNNSLQADSWFIEVEGGFLAIVAGYPDIASKDTIYAALATIIFER